MDIFALQRVLEMRGEWSENVVWLTPFQTYFLFILHSCRRISITPFSPLPHTQISRPKVFTAKLILWSIMDPTLNNNTAFYKKISTSLPDPLEERFFYKICRLQCHERKKESVSLPFFLNVKDRKRQFSGSSKEWIVMRRRRRRLIACVLRSIVQGKRIRESTESRKLIAPIVQMSLEHDTRSWFQTIKIALQP